MNLIWQRRIYGILCKHWRVQNIESIPCLLFKCFSWLFWFLILIQNISDSNFRGFRQKAPWLRMPPRPSTPDKWDMTGMYETTPMEWTRSTLFLSSRNIFCNELYVRRSRECVLGIVDHNTENTQLNPTLTPLASTRRSPLHFGKFPFTTSAWLAYIVINIISHDCDAA